MSGTWRAAAVSLDFLTAACAAFNVTYFLYRLARRREETAARTVAVLALALVFLGAMGESLFFLAALTVLPAGSPPIALPWTLVGALPLAGSAFVSALIVRQLYVTSGSEDGQP